MNPMSKHKQGGKMSRKAFTLVEVLVATALMIMVLALFLGTFVSAKRSAVIADNRMEAIHNARTAMEIALSYRYDDPQLTNGYHSNNLVISGVTNYYYYYVATTQVTPNIIVKNIYVTNSWTNPGVRMASTISLAGSIGYELHH